MKTVVIRIVVPDDKNNTFSCNGLLFGIDDNLILTCGLGDLLPSRPSLLKTLPDNTLHFFEQASLFRAEYCTGNETFTSCRPLCCWKSISDFFRENKSLLSSLQQDDDAIQGCCSFLLFQGGKSFSPPSLVHRELLQLKRAHCTAARPLRSLSIQSFPFSAHKVLGECTTFGLVSNAYCDGSLFMTDAAVMPFSEGAPVFSDAGGVLGLVLTPLLWTRGEWLGFTLCVSLKAVLQSLNLECKDEDAKLKKMVAFGNYGLQNAFKKTMLVNAGFLRGSGFSFGDGLVLTCAHVVQGAKNISIAKPNHAKGPVQLDYANEALAVPFDLAVLSSKKFKLEHVLPMTDKIPLMGEPVFGIGFHPLDSQTPTVAQGHITAVRGGSINPALLITSLSLQSGMSGGPVVDAEGNVLGVMTSHLQDVDSGAHFPNVSFVIPVCAVKEGLERYTHARDVRVFEETLRSRDPEAIQIWSRLVPKAISKM